MLARLALCLALLLPVPALLSRPAQALPVDTALVFAVDVSASVDEPSWRLQRDGPADAVESVRFMNAVTQGMIGRTAIAVMQWSSDSFVAVDWRIVASRAHTRRLALEIRVMPRLQSAQTCVARAIAAATTLLTPWTENATKRVIDISGDGNDDFAAAMRRKLVQEIAAR